MRMKVEKLTGPTVVGRIVLPVAKDTKKLVASSSDKENDRFKKKKRKRIKTDGPAGKPATPNAPASTTPGPRPTVIKAADNKNNPNNAANSSAKKKVKKSIPSGSKRSRCSKAD